MSDDAKEISDILEAVSSKVPQLLRSLIDLLYSAEAGRNMGKSVGAFYQEMVNAGIPPDTALKLAEEYLAPLRFLNQALNHE